VPKSAQKFFQAKKAKSPNGQCPYYIYGAPRGYRERFWYRTSKEAKQAADDRNAELAAFGSDLTLANGHRLEAAECIKRLMPFNKSLTDATNFYLKHLNNRQSSILVSELCDRVTEEFKRRSEKKEISKRHAGSMKETIKKFRTQFEHDHVKLLEGSAIKAWLASEPLAVKTRNRHLGYIRNILGIAQEWNLLDVDPLAKTSPFNDPHAKTAKVSIPDAGAAPTLPFSGRPGLYTFLHSKRIYGT
jgi:hypothetical protein